MELLLSGIDGSMFDAQPSPDPTPRKRKATGTRSNPPSSRNETKAQPEKVREENAHQEEDIAALLEGAENWDWDDILSPPRKKPKVCLVSLLTFSP